MPVKDLWGPWVLILSLYNAYILKEEYLGDSMTNTQVRPVRI